MKIISLCQSFLKAYRIIFHKNRDGRTIKTHRGGRKKKKAEEEFSAFSAYLTLLLRHYFPFSAFIRANALDLAEFFQPFNGLSDC